MRQNLLIYVEIASDRWLELYQHRLDLTSTTTQTRVLMKVYDEFRASFNWKALVRATPRLLPTNVCIISQRYESENMSTVKDNLSVQSVNPLMIRIALALLCLLIVGTAGAQDASTPFEKPSRPEVGGITPQPAVPPVFGPRAGANILRHRDFTGKPCLSLWGSAHRHIANPNLYDHVITAANSCPQRITIKVCYYHTDDCIPMEIPGGERKEAILGILPSVKEFGFEFREKF